MDNIQYNDFLNAAWHLAGELAHENVELVKSDSQHIEIDPECELRLCIQDPEKLTSVKEKLKEFEQCASYVCISGECISGEIKKTV